MKVEEYLEQYRVLELAIENRKNEIAKLRERAVSSSVPQGGGHSTSPSDKVGTIAAIIADEIRELEEDVLEFMSLRKKINGIIDSVEDKLDREMLWMRYIGGNTYEEIAERTGYCEHQTRRRIKNTLIKCDKMYGNVLECTLDTVI